MLKNHFKVYAVIFLILLAGFVSSFALIANYTYPRKVRGIYFDLDHEDGKLDGVNYSYLCDILLNNSNYTAIFSDDFHQRYDCVELKIIPKHSTNITIYFIKDYQGDIFFYGDMYYTSYFLDNQGFRRGEGTLKNEMNKILFLLNVTAVTTEDMRFGDDDFAMLYDFIVFFGFYFFLSIIIIYAVLLSYRKGSILIEITNGTAPSSLRLGVILIFIGLFPLLFISHTMLSGGYGKYTPLRLTCPPVSICLLVCGILLICLSRKAKIKL